MVGLPHVFQRAQQETFAETIVGQGNNDESVADHSSDAEKREGSENEETYTTDDSSDVAAEYRKEIEAHPDEVTKDALPGVKKVEATTLVWSKKAVYATYAWIWVSFFMLAFQSSIGTNVTAYAYATFSSAPQISTASILATVIGGVLKLPIAKTLNIWGRAEGLAFFTGVYVLGIIILAACNGPSSYAAGYVFYWIGYDAIYLILQVYIADTSGLRNRAFSFAFASTPFICTAFTGPLAAQSFLNTSNWRWAYGAFAIIMPFVFLPLTIVFKYYQRKAIRMGVLEKAESGRSPLQSLVFYIHEFDVIGALILIAAFVLFLLPFSLQNYGRATYGSASFIAMVIIGALLFPVFAIWEKHFAKVHFIRYSLFKERTVLGACALAAILYFSFYSWDLYYYNFVIVVYNLSVSMTGYMTQIYNIGSCFWGVVFGIWIRHVKKFKYTCLLFGLPLMFLGAGLMIHFRGQEGNIGFIVMCQIFIAFSGGTLVIGQDMAVMSCADIDGVPMLLSVLGLSSSVGGAIGYAVSGAIYTNTFPEALENALPTEYKNLTDTLYLGGYLTQMEYPVGSAVRDAVNEAWGISQRNGCIAATCILVLAIPAIAIWKDHRVDVKQNKGNVL